MGLCKTEVCEDYSWITYRGIFVWLWELLWSRLTSGKIPESQHRRGWRCLRTERINCDTRSSPSLPLLQAVSFYVCECIPISCVQGSGSALSDWLTPPSNVAHTYVHAVIFRVTVQVVNSLWCAFYISHSLPTLNSVYVSVWMCLFACLCVRWGPWPWWHAIR